jgi:hypothetical protein
LTREQVRADATLAGDPKRAAVIAALALFGRATARLGP